MRPFLLSNSKNPLGDPKITEPARDVVIVYTTRSFIPNTICTSRRTDLAKIIDRLKQMGSSVIGVDMLLDFRSAYGEDPVLELFEESRKRGYGLAGRVFGFRISWSQPTN